MQRPKKMDCFKNNSDVVGKNKRADVFLATLGLIGLLFPFTQHLFFPLTPYIKEEFGSIDTITQLTISVPSFIMALMTLIYGSISDRCGRRPVLLIGIIFYTVGGLLSAVASSITLLIFARLIQGAGAACGMVLARAIARDVFGLGRLVQIIAFLTMMMSMICQVHSRGARCPVRTGGAVIQCTSTVSVWGVGAVR